VTTTPALTGNVVFAWPLASDPACPGQLRLAPDIELGSRTITADEAHLRALAVVLGGLIAGHRGRLHIDAVAVRPSQEATGYARIYTHRMTFHAKRWLAPKDWAVTIETPPAEVS
jgi:hypothetical protein